MLICVSLYVQVLALRPVDYDPNKGMANNPDPYPQFWSMPVIALILITLLNDGTIISIAYDHVSDDCNS